MKGMGDKFSFFSRGDRNRGDCELGVSVGGMRGRVVCRCSERVE